MNKKSVIMVLILMLSTLMVFTQDKPLTRAEATNFKETSNDAEIVAFINTLQELSPNIRVQNILDTNEGHQILLAIIADPLPAGPNAKYDPRPVIYIQANIHAGEVAGTNAVQMLMREMLFGKLKNLPKQMIFLIVPNFNADGNEKISVENRNYIKTPEGGVGMRQNSQNLDLNRDYVKVDTREVRATIEKIFNEWDPLVSFDMHTTDGSFHKHNMTYLAADSPIIAAPIVNFLWKKMLPEVAADTLKKDSLLTLPYGDYVDDLKPELGWASFPDSPRLCASYVPFRGRFSVLCEAYAYANFKTRVMASHDFLLRALEFIARNSETMKKIAQQVDIETSAMASTPYDKRPKMPLAYKAEPEGTVTIQGYEVEKRTEENVYPRFIPVREKTFTIPLLYKFVPTAERTYASGYILPPGAANVVNHLILHGIKVEKLEKPMKMKFKRFIISEIKASDRLNQGHWQTLVKGDWKNEEGSVEAGSYFVSMAQPFARLIAILLEPDTSDSLLSWNFFDSWLTTQWGNQVLPYPVLRLDELNPMVTIGVSDF